MRVLYNLWVQQWHVHMTIDSLVCVRACVFVDVDVEMYVEMYLGE